MNCALIKENPDGSLTIIYNGEKWIMPPEEVAKYMSEQEDERNDTK